ncbi:hypothetical protein EJB05_55402, partial [Eragrostis curvula]
MAVPPRAHRLLALVWLAVALWLATTSGCHGEPVPYGPSVVSTGGAYPTFTSPPPSRRPKKLCRSRRCMVLVPPAPCRNGHCPGKP